MITSYYSQYVRQQSVLKKPRALTVLIYSDVIQTKICDFLLHYKVNFQFLNRLCYYFFKNIWCYTFLIGELTQQFPGQNMGKFHLYRMGLQFREIKTVRQAGKYWNYSGKDGI